MSAKVALNFWQDTGFGGLHYTASGWVGVFTGWYFPLDLSEGTTVGFLWPHTDRTIYASSSISAIVNPSNRNDMTTLFHLGGNMWPLLRESATSSNRFVSGQAVRDNVDTTPWKVNMSGRASGDNIDKPNFYSRFNSGNVSKIDTDSGKFSLITSGIVPRVDFETGVWKLSFYGMFTQPNMTGMSLSMAFSSVVYDDAPTFTTVSATTGQSISFRVFQVIYSNAD